MADNKKMGGRSKAETAEKLDPSSQIRKSSKEQFEAQWAMTGRVLTWEEQCTAPYMEVMGVKLTTCTSPLNLGSRTIWRAVLACTLSTLLFPRFSTLHPYSCTATHPHALTLVWQGGMSQ